MENLPQDPFMLMSFINMKLRDQYSSLQILCEDLQIDEQELRKTLLSAGFEYSEDNNKFW